MTTTALPTYFLSHGGGPWPFMMDQVGHLYAQLDASLRDIPRQLGATPRGCCRSQRCRRRLQRGG